jgi:hypothetical protein
MFLHFIPIFVISQQEERRQISLDLPSLFRSVGRLFFCIDGFFLLNRNAFGKISRLVNIQPADGSNVISQ